MTVTRGGEEAEVRLMTLLQTTIEHSVPDWVEQARRLGGLLIGVSSQAGRPISLAHEWKPIAEEFLASADSGRIEWDSTSRQGIAACAAITA